EKIILNALMSANEFAGISLDALMKTGIKKEWFMDAKNQIIFNVIEIYHKAGKPFDDTIVFEQLKKANIHNAEEIILEIVSQKFVTESIVKEHIEELKTAYHLRMLDRLSNEIKGMVNAKANPDAINQLIKNTVENFEYMNRECPIKCLNAVRERRKKSTAVSRIETGIPFIDTVLTDRYGNKGFRNEGLVFIGGLKQTGKTFIATRIIENVSKNHPVLFGSLEFGEDLYDEVIENAQTDGFFNGDINNIHTFDDVYDINEMCAWIRYYQKRYGIKLVLLDSMMRISNETSNLATEEKKLSDIFSKLGKLSKELKVPILIIVQTSKEDLKSSNISVKGSMNADHEAYVWFHIVKTNKDPNDEQRTVIWNKNKDTMKHPKQNLMFVPETADFYRINVDEQGRPNGALDKYRVPPRKDIPVEVVYMDSNESLNNVPLKFKDLPKL
ncbi:MAG: DnaB-like helicase C-terminal domain-containing protein, partial [Prevotella sp.]